MSVTSQVKGSGGIDGQSGPGRKIVEGVEKGAGIDRGGSRVAGAMEIEIAGSGLGKIARAGNTSAEGGVEAVGIDGRGRAAGERDGHDGGEGGAGHLKGSPAEVEAGGTGAFDDAMGAADREGAAGVEVEGAGGAGVGAELQDRAGRHPPARIDSEFADTVVADVNLRAGSQGGARAADGGRAGGPDVDAEGDGALRTHHAAGRDVDGDVADVGELDVVDRTQSGAGAGDGDGAAVELEDAGVGEGGAVVHG